MHTSFGQVIPFLGIYPRELTDIHWGTYLEICIEVIVCNSEKQKKIYRLFKYSLPVGYF